MPPVSAASETELVTVELAFSNPHARVIEETPSRLVVDLPDFPTLAMPQDRSGTSVCVTSEARFTGVELSRSLYSSNELYLVREGSGAALLVTDHFLTALRHSRPDLRAPDDDAVVDHFLFRTVPGTKTYARGVVRLGHGRTMHWDAASSTLEERRREVVERPGQETFDEALRLAEQALEVAVDSATRNAAAGAVGNLLSGGVDSTLLQSMLPRGTRSLSAAIDSPEFEPETERALTASALTASDHRVVTLPEPEYLEALERFIREVGLPPHHLQSVLLGELFRRVEDDRSFLLTAELADGAFGLGGLTWPAAALRSWGWIPRATRRLLPTFLKPHALRTAESWSRRTLPSVRSTDGLAARAACFTDFAFLAEAFGTAQIEKRLAARLEYVLDLCPFVIPDAGGVDAQIEAAHLVGYFCEDTLSIWRQAAMSQRGYLIGPFSHPAIIPAALRFRRRDRYRRSGETKPALKALLRSRLPEYDARLPKLSSGLPLERFLKSGPLRDTRYFVPAKFFPNHRARDESGYPPWIAWGILTLAAWQDLAAGEHHIPPPRIFSRRFT